MKRCCTLPTVFQPPLLPADLYLLAFTLASNATAVTLGLMDHTGRKSSRLPAVEQVVQPTVNAGDYNN